MKKTILSLLLISYILPTKAQTAEDFQKFGYMIDDAVMYCDRYVSPAVDPAIYQASNAWISSTKKRKLWDVTFGVHGNVFFVPGGDRKMNFSNSDFKFFTIEGQNSATVPTAIGNADQVYLYGTLAGQKISTKSPEGINTEYVKHAYLQASVGLPYGTELIAKYSPRITINQFDYQVYGGGLKHNIDQYSGYMTKHNIGFSVFAGYSKEDFNISFIDAQTPYGNLGINALNSNVNTYQVQTNFSHQYKSFEFGMGLIYNVSDVKFKMSGETGEIEKIIPIQEIVNTRLEDLRRTRRNFLAEFSARYGYKNFFVQGVVGVGKYLNTNLSLQYEFKLKK